jgi:hypothetical protein
MCTVASSSTPRCLNAEHERSVETVEAQEKGGGLGASDGVREGRGTRKGMVITGPRLLPAAYYCSPGRLNLGFQLWPVIVRFTCDEKLDEAQSGCRVGTRVLRTGLQYT